MTEFEKAELKKCVDCCGSNIQHIRLRLDICDECFVHYKVHLPIPPICLMDVGDDKLTLRRLCFPYAGPVGNYVPTP
jgi:hypothetical protein